MGDYWSAMAQSLGQYPAQQKAEVLGWMKSGLNYQVVQSSGTWSLQPIEMSPAGLQALKIQRGTGGTGWLWVEYRQPVGNYDTTLMTQPFGGALVHYEDATTGTFTRLLDFSPDYSWNTWWYPALPAGSSWTDPYTNLSISVVSATPGALTLNVTYTAAPCTRANPAVSASPANPSTNAGKTVPYTVTVMNNDSPGCAAGSFSLSSSQPSGWSTNFSTGTLTLNPGQSGTVTMNKGVPAGTAAGTYLVNAGASQGTAAGVGTANCTVMAAPLTASLSVPKTSYPARSTVTMTAALSGSGAAGANVTFTLTKPKGGSATKKVRADPAGKASWAYTLGAKDPPGSYSAAAEASAGAATAASNTVTFTVQ
jgi:hypothetical protein